MDGTAELRQLAHLLHIAACTARDIAATRPLNEPEMLRLADQVETIAKDFLTIAEAPAGNGRSPLAQIDIAGGDEPPPAPRRTRLA